MSKDNLKWSIYLLRCSDGSYYVGVASDITHRLRQHNSGLGPEFTRNRRPVELVYVEECENYRAARQRERQLKGWRREKKEWLIKGFPSARLRRARDKSLDTARDKRIPVLRIYTERSRGIYVESSPH